MREKDGTKRSHLTITVGTGPAQVRSRSGSLVPSDFGDHSFFGSRAIIDPYAYQAYYSSFTYTLLCDFRFLSVFNLVLFSRFTCRSSSLVIVIICDLSSLSWVVINSSTSGAERSFVVNYLENCCISRLVDLLPSVTSNKKGLTNQHVPFFSLT